MKKLIALCLLLCGCVQHSQYHLYVYYAKTCPNCHAFINQTIPLIEEKYGDQIIITTYDIDEESSVQSYQKICTQLTENPLKDNKGSVPFIVLDGYFAKVGYQINQQNLLLEAIDNAISNKSLPSALDDIYKFKKMTEEEKKMSTPHNQANLGEIAKTVLMPGDPLRAKFLAETYLEDVKQFNAVRNMLGYTGKYKGKEVSIMGSGMGQPSMGIYAYELFTQYGVEAIIRIGSCGALRKEVHLRDIIIAQGSCTDSNFAHQYELPGTFSAISTYELLEKAVTEAKERNASYHVGNVIASDVFYHADTGSAAKWGAMGCLGVEMESYALFATAAHLNKKALTLLTVSDSLVTNEETTAEEREKTFTTMMEIALEIA